MSEETAAAVVETAPAEAPPAAAEEAPAPEVQQDEPVGPGPRVSNRTQRLRATQERAQKLQERAESARQRAMEQPREEAGATTEEGEPAGGRFKQDEVEGAEQPEAAAEPEPEVEEPQAEEQAVAAEAPTEVSEPEQPEVSEEPAAGKVRIELPEGHPLRARGHTHWETEAHLENETRAMLNSVAERNQWRQERENLREQQAILEARLKARQSELPYQPNPRMEHLLEDISKTYSAEEAELIRKGLDSLNEQQLTRAEMEARQNVIEQREAHEFVSNVMAQASQRFPVWAQMGVLDRYMASALDRYGADLDRENAARQAAGQPRVGSDLDGFFRWAASKYVADPAVTADLQARQRKEQESTRERIRAEEQQKLAEQEKQRLAAAAERQANLPPPTSGVSSSGVVTESMAPERRPITRTERKRAIRERYRGR